MNPNAAFWDTGVEDVPRITGTIPAVEDCHEVKAICAELGIALPFGRLLDVGCGTGRLTQLAESYTGVDISASAVAYCQQRGLAVQFINGADDLGAFEDDAFDWIVAWSVFTHIGRDEQRAYLAQFVRLAPRLLVDILPGDPGRSARRWGCDEVVFARDLVTAGYHVHPVMPELLDKAAWARHRYFLGTRP